MIDQQKFEPFFESVAAARRFVAEALGDAPYADDVVLVTSELATNVVLHARTNFTVKVIVDDRVRLEVSDGSSIVPAVEELAESQRGLRLVEAASEEWGIEPTESGKMVWVEFPSRE
jgi:anti-sigma regulatory factor (Ser/Thr protein kinase)